jgi:hypothetical protein
MGSKLQEAIAYSKKRGDQRVIGIRETVVKDEAWEGCQEVVCPECGMTVDLCNPAIKRSGTCACGEKLLRSDGKPTASVSGQCSPK